MSSSRTIRAMRPFLRRHPVIKDGLRRADERLSVWRHSAAERFPGLIKPAPRQLTMAVTAQCNLACHGCRYGRDFMVGERIGTETALQVIDDAHAAGIAAIRYYGGEPLLHPDLSRMMERSVSLGMNSYVTTNGVLLEKRVDDLYAAGLRWVTIGFYGVGKSYDEYTQREGHFDKLQRSLRHVRDNYGDRIEIQINFVLSRRSCNMTDLYAAWHFAREFDLFFNIDLITDTVPFFVDPGRKLQFEEEHRGEIEVIANELVKLKDEYPERVPQSRTFLRSIPDWLILRGDMRVPCDAYQLVWVGADGSVKLCDVHFDLGNVNEQRLREILFTDAHCQAARNGFQLKCPNCFCKTDSRIRKHGPSLKRYGA